MSYNRQEELIKDLYKESMTFCIEKTFARISEFGQEGDEFDTLLGLLHSAAENVIDGASNVVDPWEEHNRLQNSEGSAKYLGLISTALGVLGEVERYGYLRDNGRLMEVTTVDIVDMVASFNHKICNSYPTDSDYDRINITLGSEYGRILFESTWGSQPF